MRLLDASKTTKVDDLTGLYGRYPATRGILSEHLPIADAAGMTVHFGVDGFYVKDAAGDTALVLCSELIEIPTEDGPVSGRCGLPAVEEGIFCAGHWFDTETQCDHGLTAANCFGPGHYAPDARD